MRWARDIWWKIAGVKFFIWYVTIPIVLTAYKATLLKSGVLLVLGREYSECGSPRQLLKISFFFPTPKCKYHQFLTTNTTFLYKVDLEYNHYIYEHLYKFFDFVDSIETKLCM